jgi:hypothetical protein
MRCPETRRLGSVREHGDPEIETLDAAAAVRAERDDDR